MKPLVSIYLPTHNREALLKRAVASVLAQSISDWELIVVNDGSSDGTKDYLNELAATDSRIKVLHHDTPQGACTSRNRAILQANADLVTGLDDDDEFTGQRLKQLLECWSPDYAFVCAGYNWVTGRKAKPVMCSDLTITLEKQLDMNQASNQVLTTRERMLAINGFDERFVALQDYDCFTRLIREFGPGYRIGKPLQNIYVEHSSGRISDSSKSERGFAQFLEKHGELMSERNRRNHEFLLKRRTGAPFGLKELTESLSAGYPVEKIRHYLRSKLMKQ